MAKHLRQWDRAKYERYLSEGRGFGEGKDYKPWILVQDFSSQGTNEHTATMIACMRFFLRFLLLLYYAS